MQYRFPHFGDRHVAAVECRVHMVAQRLFSVGGRDAGQRHEPAIPPAERRARPDLAEHEVDQRRRSRVWRPRAPAKVITSANARLPRSERSVSIVVIAASLPDSSEGDPGVDFELQTRSHTGIRRRPGTAPHC